MKTLIALLLSVAVCNPQSIVAPGPGAKTRSVGGLNHWFSAVANANAAPVRINFIGDSITAGYLSTGFEANSWVGQLLPLLAAHFGTTSKFEFIGNYEPSKFVLAGNWGIVVDMMAFQLGDTSATVTASLTGDHVGLAYFSTAGGSAPGTLTIDGGSPITVPGPSTGDSRTLKILNQSMGAAGTHTVVVTSDSGAGAGHWMQWAGFLVNATGETGILGRKFGVPAQTALGESMAQSIAQFGVGQLAADLTVIMYGTNDYRTQDTIADYTAGLNSILSSARGGGSCLIVSPNASQDTTLAIPESSYRAAASSVAASRGCAYVDITTTAPWTTWATANTAGYMADNLHPGDAGHANIATILATILAPGSKRRGGN